MQTADKSGCGCTLSTSRLLACIKHLLAASPLPSCLHFSLSLRDALDQLMAALAAGDAAAAVALVQQHPKLAWTRHDITEDYPAHLAAAQGQGEVLAALLAAGEAPGGQVKSLAAVKVLSSIKGRQLSFCTQQRCSLGFGSRHATCIAAPFVVGFMMLMCSVLTLMQATTC